MNLPDPGLYRTTKPYPGHEDSIPANCLVYVGQNAEGISFVVRPNQNVKNEWFWSEPTIPLRSAVWAQTLKALPSQGFYTLPEELRFEGGGLWRKNAIVQLGYNGEGKGIIFVAEQHSDDTRNALVFSNSGMLVPDEMLTRLTWAPILKVRPEDNKEA